MAFYEVVHGHVGLGSMTVFRTGEQAAADLKTFGHLTKDFQQQGGLLNLEVAFKGSASFGRVKQLENEIAATERKIKDIEAQIEEHSKHVENMTGTNLWDTIKGKSQMFMPLVWMNMMLIDVFAGFFGGFGGRAKKRAIERHTAYIKELLTARNGLMARHKKLVDEVNTTMAHVEAGTVDAKLVESTAAQQQREKDEKAAVSLSPKKFTSVLSPLLPQAERPVAKPKASAEKFAFQEDLEKRREQTTVTTRLPTGIQQIYSPALKHKTILANVTTKQSEGISPETVTGQKLVYGGLSDLPLQTKLAPIIPMAMTFGGALLLLNVMIDANRQPLRVRHVYVPRRR